MRTAGASRGALSRGGRSGPVQAREGLLVVRQQFLKLLVVTVVNPTTPKMIVGESLENVCFVVALNIKSRVVQRRQN